jgi:hypothetical protein
MRYLVGFLSIFALILLVLLLIIRGFSGDGGGDDRKQLTTYARTGTVMRLTIDGPINADLQHQGVRITVGRSETQVEILQGYRQIPVASQTYTSNEEAYGTFLRALQLMNYDRGDKNPTLRDERGFCPDGNRYIFEIANGSNQIQRYWRTSCKEGNFKGDLPGIVDLFENQIPDYGKFIKGVEL